MGRALDIINKHRFGAPPDAADHPSEVLRKIHELSKPSPAPAGTREISKFEKDTLIEALTQIDGANKARKAAEQELANFKSGKVSPDAAQPVAVPADALSYRATVSSRDAGGNLRTVELTPSDARAQAYRIKVVGRDAAGDLRSFDLMPVERARP
jgi:hypothetical protein